VAGPPPNGNGKTAAEAAPPAAAAAPPAPALQVVRDGYVPPLSRRAPTDEEMFGESLPFVHKMRASVATGQIPGPKEAAFTIMNAVGYVHAEAKKRAEAGEEVEAIPAFILFVQEKYDDFVLALLPESPSAFRAAVVKHLLEFVHMSDAAGGEQPGANDADAEDGGDDAQPPAGA
jgi:hypothetical protein